MIEKLRKDVLLKVLSLNAISVAVSFVLSLASSKIISYFLGTSGMALLGNFRNFTTLLKSGSTIGVNNAVVTLLVNHNTDREQQGRIYSTFFCLLLGLSGMIALLGCAFSAEISQWILFSENYATVVRLGFLSLPMVCLNIFFLAVYNGLNQFRKIIKIQIIASILVFICTAIGIYFWNLTGGMYALVLGEIATVLATFIFLIRDYKTFPWDFQWSLSLEFFRSIKNFAIMALVSALVGQITLIGIRNGIALDSDLNQAGLWEATNRLSAFAMTFFSTGLALYYMPRLASLKTEDEFRCELGRYFRIMLPVSIAVFLGMFLLRTWLIPLIFTQEFLPLDQFLGWQLSGEFLKVMYLALGLKLVVEQRVWDYLLVEVGFYMAYYFLARTILIDEGALGATKAYFYANGIASVLMLVVFRKTLTGFFKSN